VDINFKGLRTEVPERFRRYAEAKLGKLERLDRKAIRVDVEVSAERNPRQSDRRQRIELTISSPGPVIRAEAAADDRYAALDRACAKLEERLRRSHDRRTTRHSAPAAARVPEPRAAGPGGQPQPAPAPPAVDAAGTPGGGQEFPGQEFPGEDDVVPIPAEGDGPLVVREKFHTAGPMNIDQALLEMELVGHDFFLFRDAQRGHPSVVYRRRGYQYGVIRLAEPGTDGARPGPAPADAAPVDRAGQGLTGPGGLSG